MTTPVETQKSENFENIKTAPSAVRLKKLKDEIQTIKDKETNAENNAEYMGLNELLSFMRHILKNSPSQEEIDFIKKILEDLKMVKDTSKIEIRNLKDEKEIVDEIKIILSTLKKDVNDSFKTEENKKTISDKLKENSGKPRLDMILVGTESDIMKSVSGIMSAKFEESLKDFKLSQDEIQNISIGITKKMLDSGVFSSLAGSLNGKLSGISEKISGGNYLELLDEGGKTETGAKAMVSELNKLIELNIKPIKTKLEENPKDPLLSKLLSNPKEISEFKSGKIVDGMKDLTQEELVNFLLDANSGVIGLDRRILKAEKMKDNIFDGLASAPKGIQEGLMKLLSFLIGIPFIGDMIKGFLGYEGTDTEVVTAVGEELLKRKSIISLKGFGSKIDKDGNVSPSEKSPGIEILKNKDLKNVNIKKLEGMFAFCKAKGINTNDSKFWTTLFGKDPVFKSKDDKGESSEIKISKFEVKEDDFTTDKQPKDNFFKILNTISDISEPAKPEVPKETPAATAPVGVTPPALAGTPAPAAGVKVHVGGTKKPKSGKEAEKTPAKPEVASLPKEIKFDSGTSEVLIDGQKYKVSVTNSIGLPIRVDNIEYGSGKLKITGSKFGISDSVSYSEAEIRDAFSKLFTSGKYSGTSKDGSKTLTIEKA